MAKPTIAIDIDDVLADTAAGLVAYSNQKWGTNLSISDYSEDWSLMWQLAHYKTEERAAHLHGSGVFKTFKHNESALPVLRYLAKRYKLVIATSRVRLVRQDTLEWLELHFGGLFDEVHMAGIFDDMAEDAILATKAELVSQIGADYLVDDQPKHCFAVAGGGLRAVLFGDYAWNQHLSLPSGVTRCPDWGAVKDYFDGQV